MKATSTTADSTAASRVASPTPAARRARSPGTAALRRRCRPATRERSGTPRTATTVVLGSTALMIPEISQTAASPSRASRPITSRTSSLRDTVRGRVTFSAYRPVPSPVHLSIHLFPHVAEALRVSPAVTHRHANAPDRRVTIARELPVHPPTEETCMTTTLFVVALVVLTALVFDFTNGFHDSANAMATSVATGALRPRTAVLIAAILNVVGAFLSTEVAKTISGGMVNDAVVTPVMIFAGLVGAILWNLVDLALRPAVQLLARPVRRTDRRRAGGRGSLRGELLGHRVEDPAAGPGRPVGRRAGRRARHLPDLQVAASAPTKSRPRPGTAAGRPCRAR